jgi:hypothetical protein
MTRIPRRVASVLAVLAALLLLAAVALQVALRSLPDAVARALGPRASVQSIELGWTGVHVKGLVIRGEPGRWPAADELRADHVMLRPALSSLWRDGWTLSSLAVRGGTLSLLRGRDGKLVVVPALTKTAPAGAGRGDARTPGLRIDTLSLDDVTIDFYDASVTRGAPHRLRLTDLQAEVGPLALPALDERVSLKLAATVKGLQRDGRVQLSGRLTPSTRDADLKLDARGVDLIVLQPYLLKGGEAAVKSGSLDLALTARVASQQLNAPGRVVLRGLELQATGDHPLATFAGVPRQAVLAALQRDGRIELDFLLDGRVDNPRFSLNELFAARFAVGLAERLGVSLGGVVQGVGNVIKGLLGR